MSQYLIFFMVGFLGSFHCIGMCGGFACAVGCQSNQGLSVILRQLLYNSGRLGTYIFLGLLAGSLGQILGRQFNETPTSIDIVEYYRTLLSATYAIPDSMGTSQKSLAVASGSLMIIIALQLLGVLKGFKQNILGVGIAHFLHAIQQLLRSPKWSASLAFGVFNGFLPCPLVYAFIAQAGASASSLSGTLTMLAFGLGTFPAMLLMGGLGRVVQPFIRRHGVRIAGILIFVLGLLTIGRGLVPLAHHLHTL